MDFGVSGNISDKVKAERQFVGNLDDFGRINSVNPWDSIVIPTAKHTILKNSPYKMKIPTIEEAFTSVRPWLDPLPANPTDSELEQAQASLPGELSEIAFLISEAQENSAGELTDQIHMLKLQHKQAFLQVKSLIVERDILKRSSGTVDSTKVADLNLRLGQATKQMKAFEASFDDFMASRSTLNDQAEYNRWMQRQLPK